MGVLTEARCVILGYNQIPRGQEAPLDRRVGRAFLCHCWEHHCNILPWHRAQVSGDHRHRIPTEGGSILPTLARYEA